MTVINLRKVEAFNFGRGKMNRVGRRTELKINFSVFGYRKQIVNVVYL